MIHSEAEGKNLNKIICKIIRGTWQQKSPDSQHLPCQTVSCENWNDANSLMNTKSRDQTSRTAGGFGKVHRLGAGWLKEWFTQDGCPLTTKRAVIVIIYFSDGASSFSVSNETMWRKLTGTFSAIWKYQDDRHSHKSDARVPNNGNADRCYRICLRWFDWFTTAIFLIVFLWLFTTTNCFWFCEKVDAVVCLECV